ncbi:MAG: hypothetical protein J5645_05050 [Lachnospiraceae bacterium]|nr:hypothetical protein [Lachnospiraceae bacterium]
MKVCLLYEDRERANADTYYDTRSIIGDLGLDALCSAAAKEVIYENGEVKKLEAEDEFLTETLKNIMMIPLASAEEIAYRQEIVADAIENLNTVRWLYRISTNMLAKWNELGRNIRERIRQGSPTMRLLTEIRVLALFADALSAVRRVIAPQDGLSSRGLRRFREEFLEAFSEEREAIVRKVLEDISFYTEGLEQKEEQLVVVKPRIVLECGLEDGLRFSSMKLEEVSSEYTKFVRKGSTREKLQKFINARIPDSFPADDGRVKEQAQTLERGVVSYLVRKLRGLTDEFSTFFDQLRIQAGFYLAAAQLTEHMRRLSTEWCFPTVCDRRDLEFTDLREFVMGLTQRIRVTGNTCSLRGKDLLIVTGANQGGKSTFLRSIAIAQVMMQCGLPVTAKEFKSGIFPRIFVHFTRREDSAMNSGRLDDELKRMNGIVEHVGDGSLVFLNESFATTTEKEGAVIAYDIIRALTEAGVKVLTVTHLLSFAKRVYEETKDRPESGAAFLSAERKPDGTRTYHMIESEPELTSFGLDLYDSIVGNPAGARRKALW